jgi:hypothetical protein
MNHINTMFTNITTYGVTVAGIVVNFDNIKSFILFVLGASLLILQIIKHVKDLKKDK